MEPRQPRPEESERVSELVESSMTTSYELSPQQIERITTEEFGEEPLRRKVESDRTIVRVVETDADVDEPVVAGYVEATLDEPWGEVDWVFVDPEHRGEGLGEALFETATDLLRDAGAEKIRGSILEANAEGQDFFERFGLEPSGDRRLDVGDETLVENLYVDPSADVETGRDVQEEAAEAETELPDTETDDGTTTAETEDGERIYLDTDEPESGEEGPFFVTYTDEALSERYGYYCSNCGSLDVTADSTDRLECKECGNSHATRSSDAYDGSYL